MHSQLLTEQDTIHSMLHCVSKKRHYVAHCNFNTHNRFW